MLVTVLVLGVLPAESLAQSPATTCEKRVTFALVDARTTATGCLNKTAGADHWETSDPVMFNGVPLPVVPGTKLVLDGPSAQAPGGKISVSTSITVAGLGPFTQSLVAKNLPAGGPGQEMDFLTLSPPAGQTFLGFAVSGSVSLRLGKDADGTGYARLVTILQLPSIFKRGPTATAGGLTTTVAVRVDPAGVRTDALKLEIADAFVGQLELKNICLSYTGVNSQTTPCAPPPFGATALLNCPNGNSQPRWDGSALVALPTASRPQVGLFAGLTGGQFSYGGAQVTNLGTSLPIASGVFLDRFGLALCVNPAPFKITGSVGVRFGPVVSGTSAALLQGGLTYTDTRPWKLEALGSLALFDQQIASGYFKYQSSGAIDFGFDANLYFAAGLLKVTGGVKGWYQPSPTKFDVFGQGNICVASIVCTGGEVAVSSVGAAGCATLLSLDYPEPYWFGIRWKQATIRAGAGYRWSTKTVDLMGTSCGVGPYRATKSAITLPGGTVTVAVKRTPATVLRLQGGRGGPPKVALTSPTGRLLTLDTAGAFKARDYYYAEDAEDNTTEITLAKPLPGNWKIKVLPTSSRLTDVTSAEVEPAASAAGTVTGSGRSRVLHYVFEHQPQQSIEFFERGETYEQPLGTAGGGGCALRIPATPAGDMPANPALSCGTVAFTAAPGPGGLRRIVGVVTNDGVATHEIPVATYTAPPEVPLAAPTTVAISRAGTAVTVQWSPVFGAKTYAVAVQLGDGERMVEVTDSRVRRITLPNPVAAEDTITATVSGVNFEEVAGASTSKTLAGQPGGQGPHPEPPAQL